jgi:Holliday junction resolvase
MATTPEGKVKAKVKQILKDHEAYFFSPATGGYGASGVPDIVGCYRGYFFAIECKAGTNKPTALQIKQLDNIVNAGGEALVVNESNIDAVSEMLSRLTSSDQFLEDK